MIITPKLLEINKVLNICDFETKLRNINSKVTLNKKKIQIHIKTKLSDHITAFTKLRNYVVNKVALIIAKGLTKDLTLKT